jgi:hypothetical protein
MTFQYLAILIGPGDSIQIFSQLMELNFAVYGWDAETINTLGWR